MTGEVGLEFAGAELGGFADIETAGRSASAADRCRGGGTHGTLRYRARVEESLTNQLFRATAQPGAGRPERLYTKRSAGAKTGR